MSNEADRKYVDAAASEAAERFVRGDLDGAVALVQQILTRPRPQPEPANGGSTE